MGDLMFDDKTFEKIDWGKKVYLQLCTVLRIFKVIHLPVNMITVTYFYEN